jgi:hypothetical protein
VHKENDECSTEVDSLFESDNLFLIDALRVKKNENDECYLLVVHYLSHLGLWFIVANAQ